MPARSPSPQQRQLRDARPDQQRLPAGAGALMATVLPRTSPPGKGPGPTVVHPPLRPPPLNARMGQLQQNSGDLSLFPRRSPVRKPLDATTGLGASTDTLPPDPAEPRLPLRCQRCGFSARPGGIVWTLCHEGGARGWSPWDKEVLPSYPRCVPVTRLFLSISHSSDRSFCPAAAVDFHQWGPF